MAATLGCPDVAHLDGVARFEAVQLETLLDAAGSCAGGKAEDGNGFTLVGRL